MDRIKSLFNSKKFRLTVLFLIILLGFFIRMTGLYKLGGFWVDESTSFYVANQSSPFEILNRLYNRDAHAPLYFILLHFWMKLFGIHDIIVRLFSVIPGLFIIPVSYLIGKEVLSRKTGFILALFVSINSFLIYYSQEVRFYSLTALLGALSVLFLIKTLKKTSLKNYTGLILSNAAILYTFTIGFVFIFCEVIISLIYLYWSKRENLKPFIYAQIVTFILFIPYVPILIQQHTMVASGYINSFSFYQNFNYASILLVMQNWFSPVISSIAFPDLNYYEGLISNGIKPDFIIFAVIPVIIAITGIIKTCQKRDLGTLILSIGFLLIILEIIMTLMGKLAITSRYLTLAFPSILVGVVYGLVNIRNKFLSGSLISLFVFVNLFYLVFTPYGIQKQPSSQGYRTIASILKEYHLNSNDILILPMEGKFLGKYYSLKDINLLDFTMADICLGSEKILGIEVLDILTRKNAHDNLKKYILYSKIPVSFENYIRKSVVSKLDKGRYFVTVMPIGMKPFDEDLLIKIARNDRIYKDISLYYLLTSRAAINLEKIEKKYFQTVKIIKKDGWEVHILKK
ncbi:MAG: hypothetical protein A2287_05020 [Candidatus Melainabacteria bacterium RIFOXYA12_FULL_32_12]|nr:MAG: hypothetical protein A2287_05020 [Candidatus Melainabacteria bacterium RIFOXYA12_FULL_32_12]